MIKAVFFDIDGTLISFRNHLVPASTLLALNALREKGIKIFIATGRAYNNLGYLHKVIPIEFDGYITVNGQYCVCGKKVVHEQVLPTEDIKNFIPYLDKNDIASVFVELDYRYINRYNERIERERKILGATLESEPIDSTDRIFSHKTYQLCAYIHGDEEDEALKYLPNCRAVRWHSEFADIIPKEGGKDVGIRKMLEHFNFCAEESMAFGDGGNDIEMLNAAGIGVAMGNANEALKAVADYVTDDVDNDGILNALKHFKII